jgi:hypothetical protein
MEDNKTEYRYYPGISLSSKAYKTLSNILLSGLMLYADKSTADHH